MQNLNNFFYIYVAQDNIVTFVNDKEVKYLPPYVYDIEVSLYIQCFFFYRLLLNIY